MWNLKLSWVKSLPQGSIGGKQQRRDFLTQKTIFCTSVVYHHCRKPGFLLWGGALKENLRKEGFVTHPHITECTNLLQLIICYSLNNVLQVSQF